MRFVWNILSIKCIMSTRKSSSPRSSPRSKTQRSTFQKLIGKFKTKMNAAQIENMIENGNLNLILRIDPNMVSSNIIGTVVDEQIRVNDNICNVNPNSSLCNSLVYKNIFAFAELKKYKDELKQNGYEYAPMSEKTRLEVSKQIIDAANAHVNKLKNKDKTLMSNIVRKTMGKGKGTRRRRRR
jgi:deoxyribodipyrimidine photolyase-like uncharacterized protein